MDSVIASSKHTALHEHQRRISQFASIQDNVSQVIVDDPSQVATISKQLMKEIDPSFEKQMAEELLNESIIQNSFSSHARKRSQFDSVASKMSLYFEDESLRKKMAQNVMKQQFKKTHALNKNNNNNNDNNVLQSQILNASQTEGLSDVETSILDNLRNQTITDARTNQTLNELDNDRSDLLFIDNLDKLNEQRVKYLEKELNIARLNIAKQNETITLLQNENDHLKKLKVELALETNQTINEMRDLIIKMAKKQSPSPSKP